MSKYSNMIINVFAWIRCMIINSIPRFKLLIAVLLFAPINYSLIDYNLN